MRAQAAEAEANSRGGVDVSTPAGGWADNSQGYEPAVLRPNAP